MTINKMYTHAHEIPLSLKEKEIMSLVTTKINLQDIIVNVRSQVQKDK